MAYGIKQKQRLYLCHSLNNTPCSKQHFQKSIVVLDVVVGSTHKEILRGLKERKNYFKLILHTILALMLFHFQIVKRS